MIIIETTNAEETFKLGAKIGEQAKPGEIYTLNGDLGVGKTVFTQGVAKGLHIEEPVNSPTFTIVQVYEEAGCLFTILMYIVLVILKKWKKLDMMIIFSEMVSVSLNGQN